VRAPRRPINPLLLRRVQRSGKSKGTLALVAGWPHYVTFFDILRAEKVVATPLTVSRLQRLAEVIGFPQDEIFLDEPLARESVAR